MASDCITRIEEFFASHDGDGEFAAPSYNLPYTLIGPAAGDNRLVYSPKPGSISRALAEFDEETGVGIVGRCALPSCDDASWLRRLVSTGQLGYFGDLDPPALLIFAWLRARLLPQAVAYVGVSDALLTQLQANVPDNYTIPLSPAEREAVPVVEQVMPDIYDLVGPRCASILQAGRKMEIEAVISTLGAVEPLLQHFATL